MKRRVAKGPGHQPGKGQNHPDYERRLGRKPTAKQPANANQRHPDRVLKELAQQKTATQLKLRGATTAQIGEHLQISPRTVTALIDKAIDEYRIDRDENVKRMIAVNAARYDQAMRSLWPEACGIRNEDGTWAKEPKTEAMNLALKAMRDLNRLFGQCIPTRVEHSGANGGPIRVFDCSKLTDEQLEMIIAAEKPEDVAGILQVQGGGRDGPAAPEGDPFH